MGGIEAIAIIGWCFSFPHWQFRYMNPLGWFLAVKYYRNKYLEQAIISSEKPGLTVRYPVGFV